MLLVTQLSLGLLWNIFTVQKTGYKVVLVTMQSSSNPTKVCLTHFFPIFAISHINIETNLTYSRLMILRKTKQTSKKNQTFYMPIINFNYLSQLPVTSRNSPLPHLHSPYNPLWFHKCFGPGRRQRLIL